MTQGKTFKSILLVLSYLIILSALAVGVGLVFVPKLHEKSAYKTRLIELESKVQELDRAQKGLKEKREAFLRNPDVARRIAHEEGFVESNEVVYQFESFE